MSSPEIERSPDGLAQLYGRYRAPLIKFFQRRTQSYAEAEDLTQEVFVRIARRAETNDGEIVSSLIFAIAGNLWKDRQRAARVRTGGGVVVLDALLETAWSGPVEEIEPERVLIGKDDLSEMAKALNGLSTTTRDIFILFRIERMKQRELAELYQISASAVEKHVAKALAHLLKELALDAF